MERITIYDYPTLSTHLPGYHKIKLEYIDGEFFLLFYGEDKYGDEIIYSVYLNDKNIEEIESFLLRNGKETPTSETIETFKEFLLKDSSSVFATTKTINGLSLLYETGHLDIDPKDTVISVKYSEDKPEQKYIEVTNIKTKETLSLNGFLEKHIC